jgi:hypothetical protein
MNNWSKTKNHRKVSKECPELILSKNDPLCLFVTLFVIHYVNLKIRYSQYVSTEKTSKKMQKNALFDGFLAQKVP